MAIFRRLMVFLWLFSMLAPGLAPLAQAEELVDLVPVVTISEPAEVSVAIASPEIVPEVIPEVDSEISPVDEEEDDTVASDDSSDADALKNFEGVTRQSTPWNCGPAALATVLNQLGYTATEQQITDLYPASEEQGINLLSLKNAAIALGADQGYSVMLKKWSLADLANYITTTGDPVLAYDTKKGVGGHYSVVRSIKDNVVSISDTEAGNIEFSASDYEQMFNGYVLIVTESPDSVPVIDGDVVTDEMAAAVWGKYVPVEVAAKGISAAKPALNTFNACIKSAQTITNTASRYSARTACYSALSSELTDKVGLLGNTKILGTVLNPFTYNNTEQFDTIGSEVGQLRSQYSDLQTKLNDLLAQASRIPSGQSEFSLKASIEIFTSKSATAQGKMLASQSLLKSKQSTMDLLNSNLSSLTLTLGSLSQTISAKTSSIASLSSSVQRNQGSSAQVTSWTKQVDGLRAEINSWNSQVSSAQTQINYYHSLIASKKWWQPSFVERASLAWWTAKKISAQATVGLKTLSLNSAKSNLGYYQNLANTTGNASAQMTADQNALNIARTQQQQKQQERDRVALAKTQLQGDIDAVRKQVDMYSSVYSSANASLSTAKAQLTALQNADQTYASIASIKSQMAKVSTALKVEMDFINNTQGMLLLGVAADANDNPVNNTMQTIVDFSTSMVVNTVTDAQVCFKKGDLQQCLSTCGISADAASATMVAIPIGAACDFTNGIIYFVKGERFQAGASMFAVMPIVGSLGKVGGKTIVRVSKEAEQLAINAALKAVVRTTDIADEVVSISGDVWLLNWSRRGFAIDEGLGNNLGATFKGIDVLENRTVISIKSMDITAVTYQTASNLKSKLKSYIDSVGNFTEYKTIEFGKDFDNRAIKLALPDTALTQDQYNVIKEMKEYAKQKNIIFTITIVK